MRPLIESSLLRSAGFAHGFSIRTVNLAIGAPDYVEALGRFARAAGFDPATLRQVEQVHGAGVVVAREIAAGAPPKADALVEPRSPEGKLAVGVRVADCVPILVADPKTGAVAAIHAGWRGVVAGVVPAALARLQAASGGSPADVLAAVGPCIGPCCFEVGRDVAAQIEGATDAPVIVHARGEKAYVDLRAAVRAQLVRAGLAHGRIEDVEGCTHCDDERFFSFRRGGETGRMLAALCSQ
jgi:YfiH family protein